MLQCWRKNPIDRPDFKTIVETMKPMCKTTDTNLLSVEEQGKKSLHSSILTNIKAPDWENGGVSGGVPPRVVRFD